MKKKKLMAVILTMGLLTSACSGNNSNTSDTSGIPQTSEAGNAAQNLISGEITVSCYDSAIYQTFLEEAANIFEEQNPGTKITIESFSEMPEVKSFEQDGASVTAIIVADDPQGRADYISKTSAALMSGQGADLLAMDVLPFRHYAESGQLENLAEYMEQDSDFQKSDYRENILNAVAFNNGTWFLPLDYTFDYYTYDSTLVSEQDRSEQLEPTRSLPGIRVFRQAKRFLVRPYWQGRLLVWAVRQSFLVITRDLFMADLPTMAGMALCWQCYAVIIPET